MLVPPHLMVFIHVSIPIRVSHTPVSRRIIRTSAHASTQMCCEPHVFSESELQTFPKTHRRFLPHGAPQHLHSPDHTHSRQRTPPCALAVP